MPAPVICFILLYVPSMSPIQMSRTLISPLSLSFCVGETHAMMCANTTVFCIILLRILRTPGETLSLFIHAHNFIAMSTGSVAS